MVCMYDERLQHVFTCFITLNGQFPVFRPHAFHGITVVLFAVQCLRCVFLFPFFWPACLRNTRYLLLRIKLFVCDCDVFQRLAKDLPYLFTILHCIFSSFASWSILDDVFVVICGFRLQFFPVAMFQGQWQRVSLVCVSSEFPKGPSRIFEKFQ